MLKLSDSNLELEKFAKNDFLQLTEKINQKDVNL